MTDQRIETTLQNREQWLLTAAQLLEQNVLNPAIDALNYRDQLPPMKYAISMGEPSNKHLGTCWTKAQSTDKETSHIFITSSCNDSTTVMATLLHELIHASDDCKSGHRNYFAQVARKVGLAGKFTATYAGDELAKTLAMFIDALGDIPHHALKQGARIAPPQKARMLKIECQECAFTFRASRTQLLRALDAECTCMCCGADLAQEVQQAVN